MSRPSHVYALALTAGERAQLLRLVEQHASPDQREHLGHLVAGAADMGSLRDLAASVETPGRQPGSRGMERTT